MLIQHIVWFMNPFIALTSPTYPSPMNLWFSSSHTFKVSPAVSHISRFSFLWENILIFLGQESLVLCVCCLCVLYFASGLSTENDILIACAPRLLPTEECFESYNFKWKVMNVEG